MRRGRLLFVMRGGKSARRSTFPAPQRKGAEPRRHISPFSEEGGGRISGKLCLFPKGQRSNATVALSVFAKAEGARNGRLCPVRRMRRRSYSGKLCFFSKGQRSACRDRFHPISASRKREKGRPILPVSEGKRRVFSRFRPFSRGAENGKNMEKISYFRKNTVFFLSCSVVRYVEKTSRFLCILHNAL